VVQAPLPFGSLRQQLTLECIRQHYDPRANDIRTQRLAVILAVAPEAPLVFDALYTNWDEEYLDAKALEQAASNRLSCSALIDE